MEHKLLFVASTPGHILHFHLPYLRALRESGWEIHAACGGDEEIPYTAETVLLPFVKKMYSLKNFHAAGILRKKIRAERYAVIIVHTSLAAFFTRLAVLGMKSRPKVINMVHGYLFDEQTNPLKRAVLMAAERLTAPVTDLLLTMNQWDYATAVRHRLGKAVHNVPGIGVDFYTLEQQRIGNPDALRRTLGIPQSAFVLIYPAEFSSRKSQSVLLHAMADLPEQVTLVLLGSGALLEECKALAQTLGVADRVIFPGYISEMGPWYAMADAAVSASRSEGLPFNIMEAMYCRLPVIASAVKGHTDLITDGETGLLYPYGDHAACAEQIKQLLDSPPLAEKLARQGSERVMQYSLDDVLPQVMGHYESVLGTPALR